MPTLPTFIFAVAASIVAWFVCRYVLQPVVDSISRSESKQKRVIVRYALVLVLVVTGVIPVYYISSWFLGTHLSDVQFRLAFCAWLVQLVTGFSLYRLLHQVFKAAGKVQYKETFHVNVGGVGPSKRIIHVRHLSGEGLDEHERLFLNCETFTHGVDFLLKQINDYAPALLPDLYVGINTAGVAIASFLSGILGNGRTPIEFVRTSGENHHLCTDNVRPEKRKIKDILVIDVEVKSGNTIKNVTEFLLEKYGANTNIKVAVLVASRVRGQIENIEELASESKGVFVEDPKYLPDFLAFTSVNIVRLLYQNIQ